VEDFVGVQSVDYVVGVTFDARGEEDDFEDFGDFFEEFVDVGTFVGAD
jgi:hypothetical protein